MTTLIILHFNIAIRDKLFHGGERFGAFCVDLLTKLTLMMDVRELECYMPHVPDGTVTSIKVLLLHITNVYSNVICP